MILTTRTNDDAKTDNDSNESNNKKTNIDPAVVKAFIFCTNQSFLVQWLKKL